MLHTSQLFNNESNSSCKHKSPEQIYQYYNDYHREYLKNYRLRKENEDAQMKPLYRFAINALINVLNANSKIISEEININGTIDYYDQCKKKLISLMSFINHHQCKHHFHLNIR